MPDDTPPSGRLSTGVDLLDERLGGGVPAGSIVALSAPPRAQSEPLLSAMAAVNPTRYLSTLRPADEVRDALATEPRSSTEGYTEVRGVDGDDVLDDPEATLAGLDAGTVVVLDPTTEVEQGDRESYRSFLDACKRALRMTDSVGMFHCHENTPSVLRRGMTLARADLVWDLRTEVADGEVLTCMAVTKFRGGSPAGMFRLDFGESGVVATETDDLG